MEPKAKQKEPPKPSSMGEKSNFAPILMALAVILALNYFFSSRPGETIPYSQFLQFIDEGKIANVTISDSTISGELKNPPPGESAHFKTNSVKDESLVQKLGYSGFLVGSAGRAG